MNLKNRVGNTVMLELETGAYLVGSHLKPGSVRVNAGDQLAEGEQVGE